MRVICLRFEKQVDLQPLAEILHRLTPQISVRPGEALFLEIDQCQKIYAEETILVRIQSILKRLNLNPNISLAQDPATALAFSKFFGAHSSGKEKLNLPLRALHDYATPFVHDDFIFKECEKIIWALERLGLVNLKDFLALPPRTLASRFGALSLALHNRILGTFSLPWPPFNPTETVIERMDWGHELSCDTIESIFFYIKTLLDRSLLRLFGRGERLLSFEIKFELEKHSLLKSALRSWRFDLNLPHGTSKNILPIIRERISFDLGRRELESLVNAMVLKVLETTPANFSQRDLFHPKKEEEQEAWNTLVTRLTQKLGAQGIFCAKPVESYLPERNWMAHMAEKPEFTGKPKFIFPQRPMRLLKKPKMISFNKEQIEIDSKPTRVLSFWGPEILSGSWWEEAFERIYYRVQAETGDQYWIFQQGEKFFLHGIFD